MVGLGQLGLSYILRAGGLGYFRRGATAPHIEAGPLEVVEGAPESTYPAYTFHPEASEVRADVQAALRGLKQSCEMIAASRAKPQFAFVEGSQRLQ